MLREDNAGSRSRGRSASGVAQVCKWNREPAHVDTTIVGATTHLSPWRRRIQQCPSPAGQRRPGRLLTDRKNLADWRKEALRPPSTPLDNQPTHRNEWAQQSARISAARERGERSSYCARPQQRQVHSPCQTRKPYCAGWSCRLAVFARLPHFIEHISYDALQCSFFLRRDFCLPSLMRS
jgi:hypothetical protein